MVSAGGSNFEISKFYRDRSRFDILENLKSKNYENAQKFRDRSQFRKLDKFHPE